jgi:hypothetical protein
LTGYLRAVRRFFTDRFKGRALRVQGLRAHDLHRFILHEGQRVGRNSLKVTAAALRSLVDIVALRGIAMPWMGGAS